MAGRLARGLVGLLLIAPLASAETVQPGQRFAWSPNAGWLDARPLEEAGPGLHASAGVVSGWLWSANVGWISAHCLSTGSCAEVQYGLRLDEATDMPGLLRLSGHLWSENAGWIVAHCATTQSCGEVDFGLYVDRGSGLIDGLAWSENLGWISLSCANTDSCAQHVYGVGLIPAAVEPVPVQVFRDGFESS
jgi:hypothetical protein